MPVGGLCRSGKCSGGIGMQGIWGITGKQGSPGELEFRVCDHPQSNRDPVTTSSM